MIERVDHLVVPLSSGLTLGARLWRPADAFDRPMPAIVDYHPYRSSDSSAPADEAIYGALAARGFCCVKLDVRGTGNSQGIHRDQFDAAYWTDAVEALDWISRQPWCDGRTGMTGLSWPAHASLIVATHRPPSLGGIFPVDGADDRYLNRYQGGCLLLYAAWHGAQLSGMHLRPPLPWVVGERWREMWQERLSAYRNYFELWAAHPTFDDYWQPGSARVALDRIACPVLASVGWADTGYAASLPGMFERIETPFSAVLGPWGHCFPHTALPGPGFDFVELAAKWFDWTLKGEGAAWDDHPPVTAWLIASHEPRANLRERPGVWVRADRWPSAREAATRLGLAPGRLAPGASSEARVSIRSPLTVGAGAGEWMPWYPTGPGAHLAEDQRQADGLSLCFDGDPVGAETDILGQPSLALRVASDMCGGQIVVRLCDVAPDGASNRITYGFLNLRHRKGDVTAAPVDPGTFYDVDITLAPIGWRLKVGHRLRVAISTSYFPIVWPAAEHATLSFDLAGCSLDLPTPALAACAAPARPAPASAPSLETTVLRAPRGSRRRSYDVDKSLLEIVVDEDNGELRLEDGLTMGSTFRRTYSAIADDPLSASCSVEADWTLARGEWATRVAVYSMVTADATALSIETTIRAELAGEEIYCRRDVKRVSRGSA